MIRDVVDERLDELKIDERLKTRVKGILLLDAAKTSIELLAVLHEKPEEFWRTMFALLQNGVDELPQEKKQTFLELLKRRRDEVLHLTIKTIQKAESDK